MDDYLIECQSAEFDALARVICDLFPEQTRFASSDARGRFLSVQWLAMRFGSAPKRMTLDIRIVPAALARFCAQADAAARSHAVLHRKRCSDRSRSVTRPARPSSATRNSYSTKTLRDRSRRRHAGALRVAVDLREALRLHDAVVAGRVLHHPVAGHATQRVAVFRAGDRERLVHPAGEHDGRPVPVGARCAVRVPDRRAGIWR